jgi:hypothetical protein
MQHIQKMSRMNKYIGLALTNEKLKRKKKCHLLNTQKNWVVRDGHEKKGKESN